MTAGTEEAAVALYGVLRAHGEAMPRLELRKAADLDHAQAGAGLRWLRRLGLVHEEGELLRSIEPDAALMTTMAAYQERAAEQVRGTAELQQLTATLLTVYGSTVAGEVSRVAVEYITSPRRKERVVSGLSATARESVDSMHPGPMPPPDLLERSLRQDAELIARGIRLRCLYPQSLLQGTRYAPYLRELSRVGAQVRIIDHAPCDLLIQDGVTACLPADPESPYGKPALFIRGAALVKTLTAIYEDYWLRATPYEQAVASGPQPESAAGSRDSEFTAQERVVIRLMAAGLSDDQIARKMGVSRRTVQRAVTKLMDRLHATSRFEAGLKLAQDPQFLRQLRRER